MMLDLYVYLFPSFIIIIIFKSIIGLFNCFFFFQPAKVTAHWHKGTTYMVKFDDAVIARDKQLDDR